MGKLKTSALWMRMECHRLGGNIYEALPDKKLVSKIYRGLWKLNNKKVFKWAKIWRNTSLENIYKKQVSISKEAWHYKLLENYKLKVTNQSNEILVYTY